MSGGPIDRFVRTSLKRAPGLPTLLETARSSPRIVPALFQQHAQHEAVEPSIKTPNINPHLAAAPQKLSTISQKVPPVPPPRKLLSLGPELSSKTAHALFSTPKMMGATSIWPVDRNISTHGKESRQKTSPQRCTHTQRARTHWRAVYAPSCTPRRPLPCLRAWKVRRLLRCSRLGASRLLCTEGCCVRNGGRRRGG